MTKEVFNYKDKVVLTQNGRWYNLYLDGSLLISNMNRENGIKTYFTYVRVVKNR